MKVLSAYPHLLWRKLFGFALISFAVMSDASSSVPSSSNTIVREAESKTETVAQPSLCEKQSDVVVRFYLIRHGETLANLDGLVLGQTNSPLTASGQEQARLLGRDDLIAKQVFWRRYTSDLGRAKQTTNLILGEDESLEDLGVWLEPLLREVAKGAREMYPKAFSYDEAMVHFRNEHGPDEPFPLLESEDEVMARVYKWMFQVVRDAIGEYRLECQAKSNDASDGFRPRVFPVFAVSHSATLRAAIGRLVRHQLPTTIDFSPVGRDGAQPGALRVPNTSVTIIDVSPHNINDELWDPERESQVPESPSFLWDAQLKTLTYTKHYQDV